jgi:flagellar protein FliO/FliZ
MILSSLANFWQLLSVLFLFIIVLVGAFFVTKWLSHLQYQQTKGKNMQLIETLRIGPNKMVQLIKVGDRYFVIGLSKEHIQVISEVDQEQIKDQRDQNKQINVNFKEQFNQILNRGKKD